jgi:hypothetical protein
VEVGRACTFLHLPQLFSVALVVAGPVTAVTSRHTDTHPTPHNPAILDVSLPWDHHTLLLW